MAAEAAAHGWTHVPDGTRNARFRRRTDLIDTEEVTGSNPVSPTSKTAGQRADCSNLTTRHRPKRLSARSPSVRVIQAQATQTLNVCSSTWSALLHQGRRTRVRVDCGAPFPSRLVNSHPKRA